MSLDRLIAIMRRLRDPQRGCSWDLEQNFATIAPYTIEEAYEVADAINRGDMDGLVDELGGVVERAGGAGRLKACGTPYTGAYLVPALAWQLGVHGSQVHIAPVRAPAVIFRVRTTSRMRAVPPLGDLARARTVVATDKWRVVTACR